MSNPNIAKLTPAAARLLLALETAGPLDRYDEIIQASRIHSCLTLATALQQLRTLGFVVLGPDGEELVQLHPEEQSTEQQNSRTADGKFLSAVSRTFKATKARGL